MLGSFMTETTRREGNSLETRNGEDVRVCVNETACACVCVEE